MSARVRVRLRLEDFDQDDHESQSDGEHDKYMANHLSHGRKQSSVGMKRRRGVATGAVPIVWPHPGAKKILHASDQDGRSPRSLDAA